MTEEHEIIRLRRQKLQSLRARGNPFPNAFRRSHLAAQLNHDYQDKSREDLSASAEKVAVSGRIMLRRDMGKASFITLQDVSGAIQCYLRQDELGDDAYEAIKELWDIGDIVGVRGVLMKTNKGELTVRASVVEMLTKSLRPLPEKFHGLVDKEARYRQRYLDLMMNEESRRLFQVRTATIQAIREFFIQHDFMEVETPMMQVIPGGATARPFVTHHNALDLDLYLRVAPELNLKRLVVGGFERVFEINRNFRNEGLSTRHNPEFTMLEFYWAYHDYRDMIELTQELMCFVVKQVFGDPMIEYQGQSIDFSQPFRDLTMADSILEFTDFTREQLESADEMCVILKSRNLPVQEGWGKGKLLTEVFEAFVEERLFQPTFITQYPAEVSPLARRNDDNPEVTDRFELFVGGRELANGFSELNDAEDQAERFRQQVAQKESGDLEAMPYDQDYITALEYGLPPTTGEGLGIDRLIMLLVDSASIRDVILFPHMRPRD